MTIRIRSEKNRAGSDSPRTVLGHLRPQEAADVLSRLLKAHPDLAKEAERIAKAVLTEVSFEDTASVVEDAVAAVDIDNVYARAGKHEWGYVEPGEAALEILDSAVAPYRREHQAPDRSRPRCGSSGDVQGRGAWPVPGRARRRKRGPAVVS